MELVVALVGKCIKGYKKYRALRGGGGGGGKGKNKRKNTRQRAKTVGEKTQYRLSSKV